MYGIYIYTNIWGILMVYVTIYIAYMDPMGIYKGRSHLELFYFRWHIDNQRSTSTAKSQAPRGKIPNMKTI